MTPHFPSYTYTNTDREAELEKELDKTIILVSIAKHHCIMIQLGHWGDQTLM